MSAEVASVAPAAQALRWNLTRKGAPMRSDTQRNRRQLVRAAGKLFAKDADVCVGGKKILIDGP